MPPAPRRKALPPPPPVVAVTPESESESEEEEEPVKVECDEASAEEIESEDEEEPEDEVEEEDAIVEVTRRPARRGYPEPSFEGLEALRAAPKDYHELAALCLRRLGRRSRAGTGRCSTSAATSSRARASRPSRSRFTTRSATATSRSTKKVPAGVGLRALDGGRIGAVRAGSWREGPSCARATLARCIAPRASPRRRASSETTSENFHGVRSVQGTISKRILHIIICSAHGAVGSLRGARLTIFRRF